MNTPAFLAAVDHIDDTAADDAEHDALTAELVAGVEG